MTVLYAHLFKIWFGLFRPNLIGEEFMWNRWRCMEFNTGYAILVRIQNTLPL